MPIACQGCCNFWARHLALVILLGAVLVGGLVKTTAIPRSFGDEAWYAAPTVQLVEHGRFNIPILPGRGGVAHHYLQPKITPNLLAAIPARLLGPTLFSFRLTAIVAGMLAIAALYAFAWQYFDPPTPLVAAIALAFNVWTFMVMRTFRPEIFVIALTTCSLALLVATLNRPSGRKAFLAGLVAALALLTHQIVFAFLPVAGLIVWITLTGSNRCSSLCREWTWLKWLVLGVFTGLLPFCVYIIYADLSSPASFFEQLTGEGSPVLWSLSGILTKEATRWYSFLQLPLGLPVALLYVLAPLIGFKYGNRADKSITFLCLWSVGCLACLVPLSTSRYAVLCLPWLAIALARAWHHLRSTRSGRLSWVPLTAFSWLAAGGYLLVMVVSISMVLRSHWHADYNDLIDRLARHFPQSETTQLAGPVVFWLGFHHTCYQVTNVPPRFDSRDHSPEDWLPQRLQQAHFILETTTPLQSTGGIGPRPTDFGRLEHLRALQRFAQEKGRLIATEPSSDFGPIRIWRVVSTGQRNDSPGC